MDLHWPSTPTAAYYRVELTVASSQGSSAADAIHRAFVPAGVTTYRLPPFVFEKSAGREVMWRVVAVDADSRERQIFGMRRITTAADAPPSRQP
jgi:hypothetical protein